MKNNLLTQHKPLAIYSKLITHSLPFRITLLLIVTILLSSSSCKKEDPIIPPDLPPLTSTGEMTFGCYINGEPWIAYVPPFIPTEVHLAANLYLKDSILAISATRVSNTLPREAINLQINDFGINTGNFIISNTRCYANYSFKCNSGIANNDFNLITDSINTIDISFFNLEKRIVSGTFSFVVSAENCPDETIQIDKGRFDISFGIIE